MKRLNTLLSHFQVSFQNLLPAPAAPASARPAEAGQGSQGPGLLQIQGIENFELEHCTCTKR